LVFNPEIKRNRKTKETLFLDYLAKERTGLVKRKGKGRNWIGLNWEIGEPIKRKIGFSKTFYSNRKGEEPRGF